MGDAEWIAAASLVITLGFAVTNIVRSSRLDQIDLLRERVKELEEHKATCERQLENVRTEMAWMRSNMVLKR